MVGRWMTIGDYLVYLGFRLFEMFVRMFDVRVNYRTFCLLGDLWYRLVKRHRLRAVGHLRRSFPDWPQERIERVARESIRGFFCLGLEVLFSTRRITPATWNRFVRFRGAGEYLRLSLERKHPLLMVTAHLGNWEVLAYTMSVVGLPFFAIARAIDNVYLDRYLRTVRQRRGLTVLDKKGATERVDGILEAKGSLGWLADQDAGRKGLFVDFFGRKASTFKSIGLLAIRHEAPIFVGYAHRLDRAFHFEIVVSRIIEPREWAGRDDAPLWITREYTRVLEEAVRLHPEQYLWAHRRWKHRPKGEEPGPDGIA